MALVPEDNNGLANADSYVTLDALKAYATARNIDLSNYDDTQLEAAARAGFAYVNANWAYKSTPKTNDQAGEFPRVDLSDGMGRVFNVVPQRVKDAQCEAAILHAGGESLFVVADRGGQIVSETVGPISTTYAAGATPAKLFGSVESLLRPFVRDPNNPRQPIPSYNDYSEEGTSPTFSIGMDDNTEAE